ncbi:hypothetical protein VCHA43P277_30417 [Vibrio chagasii]|nr:hypothetical protein VCHA34P126_110096 [Vibrio chagasii]CAH7195700.1 hypothetical protein VCHA50P420_130094 [Vibrio chagasii]CAH7222974.1 hypothetical protein VCHA41O247_20082 [Vibrio chagasii]CAH7244394.1 hypothetical protein VCHA43P277_30417 [Vibrio chagasii]
MNILKHFYKKKHEPRKFVDLDEALLTISNEVNNLAENEAGFLRFKPSMTPKQLHDMLKGRIAQQHRMKRKLVTDAMVIECINATEKNYSLAGLIYRELVNFFAVSAHDKKVEETKAIQAKIDFFTKRQRDHEAGIEGEYGHDFDTNFSHQVDMNTLHSMVLNAWFENVHPIRKVSETTFAEWLESNESDCFVVTCYIAICDAEKFISTKTEDQEETLHYTTRDIERYAAIRERGAIYDQIEYEQERKDRYQELYEQAGKGCEDQVLFELQVFTHDEEIKRLQDRRDSLKELSGGIDL